MTKTYFFTRIKNTSCLQQLVYNKGEEYEKSNSKPANPGGVYGMFLIKEWNMPF